MPDFANKEAFSNGAASSNEAHAVIVPETSRAEFPLSIEVEQAGSPFEHHNSAKSQSVKSTHVPLTKKTQIVAGNEGNQTRVLSKKERFKHFGRGLLGAIPGLTLLGVDALLHGLGLWWIDEGPLGGWLHRGGLLLFLKSKNNLDAAWRGYIPSKRDLKKPEVPYDGSGYPESATTYAIENLRGFHDEGIWKKAVSIGVVAGSFVTHTVKSAWNTVVNTLRSVETKSNQQFVFPFNKFFFLTGGLITLPFTPLIGAGKGVSKWSKRVSDGFKKAKTISF
ncbi:hypothetical protein HY090_01745 [Candidatus Kaiserbacteria bacterium]|nr:hypothetical protein [Candidatus Kaiserbacteria bacterium]